MSRSSPSSPSRQVFLPDLGLAGKAKALKELFLGRAVARAGRSSSLESLTSKV